MDNTTLIVVLVTLVVAAAFLLIWMRQGKAQTPTEGHGLDDEVAAAVEDVAGELLGVEAHADPLAHPAPPGPADDLTRLKGLGPKVATQFREMGVTHFAQIASWSEADVAAIDAHMGAFRGRIARDRWVEQAALLARDDIAGFEAKFGKLGE